jgi:hypothetical protein
MYVRLCAILLLLLHLCLFSKLKVRFSWSWLLNMSFIYFQFSATRKPVILSSTHVFVSACNLRDFSFRWMRVLHEVSFIYYKFFSVISVDHFLLIWVTISNIGENSLYSLKFQGFSILTSKFKICNAPSWSFKKLQF